MDPRSSPPRLVILASDAPATLFAIHSLFDRFPQARWILPDWSARRPASRKRKPARPNLIRRVQRVLRSKVIESSLRRRNARVRDLLVLPESIHQRVPDLVISAHQFNSPPTCEQVAAWRPDLIVTSGVPILRDAWLQMATHGCINVHFGIAPDYRGEHTLFHPLLERQWEKLGFTIHRLDKGVDSGPILAHGFPELGGTEDEAAIWAKCAQLASRLLPRLVGEILDQRVSGMEQNQPGRMIRYLDRTLWQEFRLRYGNFRPPLRPESIQVY